MGTKATEVGPTATRVASNIKRIREDRRPRMTLDDLSARLEELGRPILKSGLSKIENGDRRVDVDDLVAIAVALGVTPNALLLDPEADSARMALTPARETSRRAAWFWAQGEEWDLREFAREDFPWTWFNESETIEELMRKVRAARPYSPLAVVELGEMAAADAWFKQAGALREKLKQEGAPDWVFKTLFGGQSVYVTGPAGQPLTDVDING